MRPTIHTFKTILGAILLMALLLSACSPVRHRRGAPHGDTLPRQKARPPTLQPSTLNQPDPTLQSSTATQPDPTEPPARPQPQPFNLQH